MPQSISTARIAKRLAKRVRRRNAELRTHVLIEAGMGLAVTGCVYGLMFAATWMLGLFLFVTSISAAIWFALAVTGTFFLVAVVSAWRKVDPAADLTPPPPQDATVEWMENVLADAAGVSIIDPRFAVAGAGMLLLSGPENLLDALATWRRRLRNDEDTLTDAAALLVRCRKGATAEDIRNPRAAILLRQLTLIRVVTATDVPRLELTDRGGRLLEK